MNNQDLIKLIVLFAANSTSAMRKTMVEPAKKAESTTKPYISTHKTFSDAADYMNSFSSDQQSSRQDKYTTYMSQAEYDKQQAERAQARSRAASDRQLAEQQAEQAQARSRAEEAEKVKAAKEAADAVVVSVSLPQDLKPTIPTIQTPESCTTRRAALFTTPSIESKKLAQKKETEVQASAAASVSIPVEPNLEPTTPSEPTIKNIIEKSAEEVKKSIEASTDQVKQKAAELQDQIQKQAAASEKREDMVTNTMKTLTQRTAELQNQIQKQAIENKNKEQATENRRANDIREEYKRRATLEYNKSLFLRIFFLIFITSFLFSLRVYDVHKTVNTKFFKISTSVAAISFVAFLQFV